MMIIKIDGACHFRLWWSIWCGTKEPATRGAPNFRSWSCSHYGWNPRHHFHLHGTFSSYFGWPL